MKVQVIRVEEKIVSCQLEDGHILDIDKRWLPVKDWPAVFKDATIADAVLDRIVRNAHRINLKGPSRRPVVNALSE